MTLPTFPAETLKEACHVFKTKRGISAKMNNTATKMDTMKDFVVVIILFTIVLEKQHFNLQTP